VPKSKGWTQTCWQCFTSKASSVPGQATYWLARGMCGSVQSLYAGFVPDRMLHYGTSTSGTTRDWLHGNGAHQCGTLVHDTPAQGYLSVAFVAHVFESFCCGGVAGAAKYMTPKECRRLFRQPPLSVYTAHLLPSLPRGGQPRCRFERRRNVT